MRQLLGRTSLRQKGQMPSRHLTEPEEENVEVFRRAGAGQHEQ